ncbi:unnamed protein product, partial [Mesorhabditis spiculigera]
MVTSFDASLIGKRNLQVDPSSLEHYGRLAFQNSPINQLIPLIRDRVANDLPGCESVCDDPVYMEKVHVWKPAASRLESAEIFVVCEKYSKPDKVDPDLLNVKKVFLEPNLDPAKPNSQALLLNKKTKKARAEGYAESDGLTLHKTIDATTFVHSSSALDLLAQTSSIKLDQPKWSEAPETTDEVKECLKDIKLCGPRELRILLKWRKKMLDMVHAAEDADVDMEATEPQPLSAEDLEDQELANIEAEIARASAEEKSELKKKKKKMLREKAKVLKRKQLKMIHGDDPGIFAEMPDLFALKNIKKGSLATLTDEAVPDISNIEDDEYGLGEGEWEEHGDEAEDNEAAADADDEDNELIHTEQSLMTPDERKKATVREWKNQPLIKELLSSDDSDDELDAVEKYMRKKGTLQENTVSFEATKPNKTVEKFGDEDDEKVDGTTLFDAEMESEEEYEDEDKRVAKRKKEEKKNKKEAAAKKRKLTPEELALGEQLIYSTKTRRDLEDWGWHRFSNNDENLPDWFVEDEQKHYKKDLPVTKEQVKFYKERMKEINVRPIKKVAEAKARKARRVTRRLEKAKKKAEAVVENENLEHSEKVREMKKIYRNANKKEDKKKNVVVVTKSNRGRMSRPNGRYKTVDARMKTELRAQKAKDRRSGVKGKRGGGRGKGRR